MKRELENIIMHRPDMPKYGSPIQIPSSRMPSENKAARAGEAHKLLDMAVRARIVNSRDRCSGLT